MPAQASLAPYFYYPTVYILLDFDFPSMSFTTCEKSNKQTVSIIYSLIENQLVL